MTALTTEQFKEHFKIEKNAIVLSPQIGMIANLCGYNEFDYQNPKEIIEPTKKYDYVLIDVLDTDKFPGLIGGVLPSYRYLEYALKFLSPNGTMIGKFPSIILNRLRGSRTSNGFPHSHENGYTKSIHIHDNYCFIEIGKVTDKKTTTIFYKNKEKFEINFLKESYPILHHYNEEYYNYLKNVDLSKSCQRTTIDGKGDYVVGQLSKRSKRNDFENALFVPSNGNKAKAFTIEQIKGRNIGGDAFFAKSVQQRDQYIKILQNPKVIDLINEMCYNNYSSMKLDHKKYIFNESIFSFANS